MHMQSCRAVGWRAWHIGNREQCGRRRDWLTGPDWELIVNAAKHPNGPFMEEWGGRACFRQSRGCSRESPWKGRGLSVEQRCWASPFYSCQWVLSPLLGGKLKPSIFTGKNMDSGIFLKMVNTFCPVTSWKSPRTQEDKKKIHIVLETKGHSNRELRSTEWRGRSLTSQDWGRWNKRQVPTRKKLKTPNNNWTWDEVSGLETRGFWKWKSMWETARPAAPSPTLERERFVR